MGDSSGRTAEDVIRAIDRAHTRFFGGLSPVAALRSLNRADLLAALRRVATDIAESWAKAHHQQQTRIYLALVEDKRSGRTTWQRMAGVNSDFGQPPEAPQIPLAPAFMPTRIPNAEVPGMNQQESFQITVQAQSTSA